MRPSASASAPPTISVASRTGDTPTEDRREIARHPPDILITTPESLYLMLTSQVREVLRGVEHVIVDEVHAIAGTKRGAHLALSLERLERLRPADAPPHAADRPVRHATAARGDRPVPRRDRSGPRGDDRRRRRAQAARPPGRSSRSTTWRPSARSSRSTSSPGGPATSGEARNSIWPAIHPKILELIRSHHSTIVFTNSRRLSERLAQRLNDLAGEDLVKAHHGSIAREQRLAIEEDLKAGRLPALVATSSLELGIDMGAVDLVIQVESPTSVARGLQRVGRAGHQVGAPSKGVIFPKYRGDLLEVAVVTRRMHEGAIEATAIPRNPLDVLAQQLVAMTVMDPWTVADLLETVTRATPYETLTRELLEGVLGMLAGAYPSDEFAELKPRVTWDRVTDVVEGRRDARVVAITSGGTIPDRGLYGVFMAGEAGTPGPSRRRARRGDGLRAAGRDARRRHRARCQQLAGRRDRPRPGHGHAGARRPGQAAVLEGRRGRAPDRARPGDGRVHRRDRSGPGEGQPRPRRGDDAAARAPRPRRARRRQPARLPRRRARGDRRAPDRQARSSSSASATSSATGGCAC